MFFSKTFCHVKTDEMAVDCYLKLLGGEGGYNVISSWYIRCNEWLLIMLLRYKS